MSPPSPAPPTSGRPSLLVIAPLVVFSALAVVFFVRLRSGADPAAIPSALIGRPAPAFALDPVPGLKDAAGSAAPGLASVDFAGRVTVVNFWASWCAPCQIEHPQLMRLGREPGVRLVGVAYKDAPENSRRFLARNGDPFQAVGMDSTGRVGIDFGVYGVPESFIVGPDGLIRDKLVGIVTAESYAAVLDKIRSAGAPKAPAPKAPAPKTPAANAGTAKP